MQMPTQETSISYSLCFMPRILQFRLLPMIVSLFRNEVKWLLPLTKRLY